MAEEERTAEEKRKVEIKRKAEVKHKAENEQVFPEQLCRFFIIFFIFSISILSLKGKVVRIHERGKEKAGRGI